jgi:hypothetical protein
VTTLPRGVARVNGAGATRPTEPLRMAHGSVTRARYTLRGGVGRDPRRRERRGGNGMGPIPAGWSKNTMNGPRTEQLHH